MILDDKVVDFSSFKKPTTLPPLRMPRHQLRALAPSSVLSWPTVELCPLGRLRIFESESLDPFVRSEESVLPPFHPILNNVQKILDSSPCNPI